MSTPDDHRLLGLLEPLSPEHLARLKAAEAPDEPPYRCAHCGGVIESTGGHDWIGPGPAPGETQKRYHFSPAFPDCRRASGACGTDGGSDG